MEETSTPASRPRTVREDPANEVYEVFVAELDARRERLRQLLDAVAREAARCARPRAALVRARRNCRRIPDKAL